MTARTLQAQILDAQSADAIELADAIDHDTTVNALIRSEFGRIARQEDRVKRGMRELRKMSDRAKAETGPVTWTREDVDER